MSKPVVVVGAGIAGLVCARRLHQEGVPVLVVDAESEVGGRLRTQNIGGFKLDQGYPGLFTAFPHLRREVNLDALHLHPFDRQAVVFAKNQLTVLEPESFLDGFRNAFGGNKNKTIPPADRRRLARLKMAIGEISTREAFAMDATTTEEYLEEFGFSQDTIDAFFRPFCGAFFLDPTLHVDARQFSFVWSMLSQGALSLPEGGMQSVANQIAADIPRYLFRLGNRVSELIYDGGKIVGVRYDTSETLEASAVVVATDIDVASNLVGQKLSAGHKSSTCLYFETPTPITEGKHIVFNGSGQGRVNHVVPITAVTPSYAPAGKHMASATIVGNADESDEILAESVKGELNSWFPDKGTYMWRFIKAVRVKFAQLDQRAGYLEHLPGNATGQPGVYWAGEFTQNASLDGAIRSGRECANLLLSERGELEAA